MEDLCYNNEVTPRPLVYTVGRTSLPIPVHPAFQDQIAKVPRQFYTKPVKGTSTILPGFQEYLEPVYQPIGDTRKQKGGEKDPPWAPKPSLIYGVITEKQVAKYVTPDPVRIRVDGLRKNM